MDNNQQFQLLVETLEASANLDNAEKMRAYVKDKFLFLGIKTPLRRTITRPWLALQQTKSSIDWDFVSACWQRSHREYQYVAIDYINARQKLLVIEDLSKLEALIVDKSWWETVDGFHRVIGNLTERYPELTDVMIEWSTDVNIWLRRIAIDHQLLKKQNTDPGLLAVIIKNNLNSNEFFINKAIGWALRDYSKTDPVWVQQFIDTNRHHLASLSIREASKYL